MPVEFVGSLRLCSTTRSSLYGCLVAKLGSVTESSFRSVQFPQPWMCVVCQFPHPWMSVVWLLIGSLSLLSLALEPREFFFQRSGRKI